MDDLKLDDTIDFSALDVLSSSSTPRLLAQDRATPKQMAQNNDQNKDEKIAAARADPESEYSIHLSAIGGQSASSTLNLEREILKIDSDDIGGPSDFTLNMADWINGDKKPKVAEYKQPSVEDSITPLPTRLKDLPTVQEGELLKSSQCLTTPPQKPQDDLYAQLAALQAKCARLQQSNEELTTMLDSYRTSAARQTDLEAQLRREQDIRHEGTAAAEKAQQASDRELQRAEERVAALQDALSVERAAAGRAHDDAELAQQELHDQISLWKQRTSEYRQKCQELQAKPAIDVASVDAEAQLTELKQTHEQELADLRQEYDSVARDVDDWMLDKIKAKDEHYAKVDAKRIAEIATLRARNQELEKMYSLCGKELMLSWGRDEFGAASAGERQRYRYQS